MSSLALGPGLDDLELWLGGLFTATELAAADLLLQLSVAGAGADDEAAESSASSATYSSRSPCLEDLTAEEEVEREERVVEETALPLPLRSLELDRRARKRYRLLSDIYAATSPVTSAVASASASASGAKNKKKRRRHHHGDGDDDGFGSSSSEETRYGGEH